MGRTSQLELLDILPIKGGGLKGAVRGIAQVLSIGGYAAGPVSFAARVCGISPALLEPNSTLGLANRLLVPFARGHTWHSTKRNSAFVRPPQPAEPEPS